MKKTVVLMRVSTDMQDTVSQRTAIENYIDTNKIIVDAWIEEKDVSGYTVAIDKREGLQEIKQMALKGEIDRLIVFNLDRIGRQTEALSYIVLLNELGVKIYSITEGEIDGSNINNQLLTYIKLWQSQTESAKASERIKAGLTAKNNKNQYSGGAINYGYKLNKETGQLEIEPHEASIVKKIFNLYITYGSFVIENILRDEDIKKRKTRWTAAAVTKMLKNTIYIGYKQYNYNVKASNSNLDKSRIIDLSKLKTQDYNADFRIIDDELFYKVQQLMDERNFRKYGAGKHRRTVKSEQLLESIIFHNCEDGNIRRMYIDYNYRKVNGGYEPVNAHYKCLECKRTKSVKQKTFSVVKIDPIVEDAVFQEMGKLNMDKLKIKINEYKNNTIKDLEIKIKQIKTSIKDKQKVKDNALKELELIFLGESSLTKDIISNIINSTNKELDTFNMRLNVLEKELNIQNNKITDINKLYNKFDNFKIAYRVADAMHKKAMINEIIEKVIIDEDCVEVKLNLIRL